MVPHMHLPYASFCNLVCALDIHIIMHIVDDISSYHTCAYVRTVAYEHIGYIFASGQWTWL